MPKRGIRAEESRLHSYGAAVRSDATRTYGMPGYWGGSRRAATLTANRLTYGMFYVPEVIVVDSLFMEVRTAGAASTVARLGLYRADDEWQPTDLIVDAGTVAVDTTGSKTATVDVRLVPGRYLTAYNTDGTPAINALGGGPRWTTTGAGDNLCIISVYLTETLAAFSDPGNAWTNFATSNSQGMESGVFLRWTVQ